MQGPHPLMRRSAIDLVRPSRFEESLQTPGGTVQRDLGLAAPWDSRQRIALSGLENGMSEVLGWHRMWRDLDYAARMNELSVLPNKRLWITCSMSVEKCEINPQKFADHQIFFVVSNNRR